jgi:hypothetical protein
MGSQISQTSIARPFQIFSEVDPTLYSLPSVRSGVLLKDKALQFPVCLSSWQMTSGALAVLFLVIDKQVPFPRRKSRSLIEALPLELKTKFRSYKLGARPYIEK